MRRFLILPLAALCMGAAAPPADAGSTLTITVTNLRNAKGLVQVCMTTSENSFPECRGDPEAYTASVSAQGAPVTATFRNVRPGRYAVALLHDSNANGKADFALGMIPKEGFGFSRDAPVRMGPPSFDSAAFDFGAQDRSMAIRMRYLL